MRVAKAALVERGLRSESHQLYGDKDHKDRAVPMGPIVRETLLELNKQSGNAENVFANSDTDRSREAGSDHSLDRVSTKTTS